MAEYVVDNIFDLTNLEIPSLDTPHDRRSVPKISLHV